MPSRVTVVRWQGLQYNDREHLVLTEDDNHFLAQSIYMSSGQDKFGVYYEMRCDKSWNFQQLVSQIIGKSNSKIDLRRDEQGRWYINEELRPELAPATDVDISISPFTNTLPIKRLNLTKGASSDIQVAYVKFPDHSVSLDPQRYTCLSNARYLFESVDTDFQAEIQVDDLGLVTMYPELFARI